MMERFALVRLRADTPRALVGGRVLAHHSQFGNLHAVPLAAALRLIDNGEAKLLRHMSTTVLRKQVAEIAVQRQREAAELAEELETAAA